MEPPIIIYTPTESAVISYKRINNNLFTYNSNINYLTLIISSLLPFFIPRLRSKIKKIEIKNLDSTLSKNIFKYTELLSKIRFIEKDFFISIVSNSDLNSIYFRKLFQLYPEIGDAYSPPINDERVYVGNIEKSREIPKRIKQCIKDLFLFSNILKNNLKLEKVNMREPVNLNGERYDGYTVNNLFKINRFFNEKDTKTYYIISIYEKWVNIIPIIWFLSTYLGQEIPSELKFGHGFLNEVILHRKNVARKFLSEYLIEIPETLNENISVMSTLASMGLLKLAPFLLDENVEEIYVDAPSSKVYLDHSEWGRCESNILMDELEMERVITHLKAESGLQLDYNSPSLKTDIITDLFRLRVSVDIYPLIDKGSTLIFRRFRNKPLTIIDLIKNNTISLDAAAYLLLALFHKRNILAVGEPASGKTTLINALDMFSPSYWRKISVEEVVESLDLIEYGKHQIRYRVDPFEKDELSRKKTLEIVKLLHRSPNYIFFGELLTQEHVFTFIQAIESGLHGIQTTHATSPEALLRKWILYYKVPPQSIAYIELIVYMKRELSHFTNKRFVARISEPIVIQEKGREGIVEIFDIFTYNYKMKKLIAAQDIFASNLFRKISFDEDLSENELRNEFLLYKESLEDMLSKNLTPLDICNIVNKILLERRKLMR